MFVTRFIWLRSSFEIRKLTFLRIFRRSLMLVSTGIEIVIERAGASKSKKLAIRNLSLGALTTSGQRAPHSGRRYTQRSTYSDAPRESSFGTAGGSVATSPCTETATPAGGVGAAGSAATTAVSIASGWSPGVWRLRFSDDSP